MNEVLCVIHQNIFYIYEYKKPSDLTAAITINPSQAIWFAERLWFHKEAWYNRIPV